jgi:hypothetical protein
MAYSSAKYQADGSTKLFSVPFAYLDRSHVEVSVGSIPLVAGVDYTWTSSSSISLKVAPAAPNMVQIKRNTPKNARQVQYQDSTVLTQELMNKDANQLFYIEQEALDAAENSVTVVLDKGITNVVAAGTVRVLNIPGDFPDVKAAMAGVAGWIIPGTLQLKLGDSVTNVLSSINLNHPYGHNIQIIGNLANPAGVVFMTPAAATFDVFLCTDGHSFGLIDGIKVAAPTKQPSTNNTTGILAVRNSSLTVGSKVLVDNLFYSIAARDGSLIVDKGAICTNAGDVSKWAFTNSTYIVSGGSAQASDPANNWGYGHQAEYGSLLMATGSAATACFRAGFAALSNSTLRLSGCNSNGNVGSGYMSKGGGVIEGGGSVANNNQAYGIELDGVAGGSINGVTGTGNALDLINSVPFFGITGGMAKIGSTAGGLRIDVNDASSVYFNSVNGCNGEILDGGPGHNNRLVLRGGGSAYAYTPALIAKGDDAVIDIRLVPKGNGSHVDISGAFFAGAPAATHYFQLKIGGQIVRIPCLPM